MEKKDPVYYESPRPEIIRLIPGGVERVLDVGCGAGIMGSEIKRALGKDVRVVGLEINTEAAEKARGIIDEIIIGDAESISLPFAKPYFDCIIYGDALEHFIDPWALLSRHVEYLREGGTVIASIPNIAHYRIIRMLRKKEWYYTKSGVLDETHLRFFTIKTIQDMFARARLKINKVDHILKASRQRKALNRLLLNLFIDDLTEQYLITATKGPRQ